MTGHPHFERVVDPYHGESALEVAPPPFPGKKSSDIYATKISSTKRYTREAQIM